MAAESRPQVVPAEPRPALSEGLTEELPAVQPWLWPDDMQDVQIDEAEQTRALAALIEAFAGEPWFVGFFVWRYYADLDDVSQEAIWGFSPHGKSAEVFLEGVFGVRMGADPDPWDGVWWAEEERGDPYMGIFGLPGRGR